jgi:glycosyltransferase 2 family protein
VLDARLRMSEDSQSLQPLPEPSDRVRASWLVWARAILLLIVAACVGVTLWRLGRSFRSDEVELRWSLLLIVTACLVVTNLMQAMAWVRLLNRMAHRVLPIAPILSGFMAGQLARYIPTGKVALLVVRTAAIGKLGLSPRLVASSIAIEVLSWLTVGMLLGTAATLATGHRAVGLGPMLSAWSLPLALATVIAIVLLVTVDRRRFPRWALRAVRAEGLGPIVPLRVLGWQAGSWLGPVIQGLLLPMAVGANFSHAWPNVGMFLLAPIAGFLALVAPGGLGVREAILSYALAADLGASRALAVALLARASFVVSEVLSWIVTRWLSRPQNT